MKKNPFVNFLESVLSNREKKRTKAWLDRIMEASENYDVNDSRDQLRLGLRYYNGEGVSRDYTEAVTWFRRAASQGVAEAWFKLGCCYVEGNGVPQDETEAAACFQKAAKRKHREARFNLGWCYYYGYGVSQDYKKAAKWYLEHLETPDPNIRYSLVPPEQAQQLVFRNKMDAEKGDARSQYSWALANEIGEYVSQNYAEAAKWFRCAAEQGNRDAQFKLGLCYEEGKGVVQDYVEAAKWFRRAAERDPTKTRIIIFTETVNGQTRCRCIAVPDHTQAQVKLGLCYDEGKGVHQDSTEAMKWFRVVADRGYGNHKALSM